MADRLAHYVVRETSGSTYEYGVARVVVDSSSPDIYDVIAKCFSQSRAQLIADAMNEEYPNG